MSHLPPLDSSQAIPTETGSAELQVSPPFSTATSLVQTPPVGVLQPIGTAAELIDLATSSATASVKRDVAIGLLVRQLESQVADLKHRLACSEEQSVELTRELKAVRSENSDLIGDVRELKERERATQSDKTRRNSISVLGGIVLTLAGAFIGHSVLGVILCAILGVALYYIALFNPKFGGA